MEFKFKLAPDTNSIAAIWSGPAEKHNKQRFNFSGSRFISVGGQLLFSRRLCDELSSSIGQRVTRKGDPLQHELLVGKQTQPICKMVSRLAVFNSICLMCSGSENCWWPSVIASSRHKRPLPQLSKQCLLTVSQSLTFRTPTISTKSSSKSPVQSWTL